MFYQCIRLYTDRSIEFFFSFYENKWYIQILRTLIFSVVLVSAGYYWYKVVSQFSSSICFQIIPFSNLYFKFCYYFLIHYHYILSLYSNIRPKFICSRIIYVRLTPVKLTESNQTKYLSLGVAFCNAGMKSFINFRKVTFSLIK